MCSSDLVLTGDTLHMAREATGAPLTAPPALPGLAKAWQVRVLAGPHGAPDFFTAADIAMICETPWQVHYNSSRPGVRLSGPRPQWARADGGEAGLHPSNIHDNPYAVGAVDFTGDMPIILGPDGPSLGGFVCPFVVIAADLWKVGQLAPGDSVTFVPVSDAMAAEALAAQDALVAGQPVTADPLAAAPHAGEPVLRAACAQDHRPAVCYRRQGDQHLLVEYGPIVLDLELRLRVHALMLELDGMGLPGIIDVTPGIRSLQIHYDSRKLSQSALLSALEGAEERLGSLDDFVIPSRTVYLPLSWNDPAIHETVARYAASVRDDAPWCPDNIEFIRRVNGLASVDEVQRIVFDAEYLVMGLGDVYLGAPVATPVDPRHRLVTTKYNPARTWTPPNVVGIGGAYMCIYGMEGPGGYQLFGRTIQVWNAWRQTQAFTGGKPWLLRFFDRIRFFPVSHEELTEWRRDFPLGRRKIAIEDGEFRLSDYRAMLADNAASIARFQQSREAAFAAERARWEDSGEFSRVEQLAAEADDGAADTAIDLPEGCELVESPFGGLLWSLAVREGETIEAGQRVATIEAMKMESPVVSPVGGVVRRIYTPERKSVTPGAPLLAVEVTP